MILDSLVMGHGRFSMVIVNLTEDDGFCHPGNRGVNGAFFRNLSLTNGIVGAVNLAALHGLAQDSCTQHVFCNYGKSCGVPVQTVDTAKGKEFVLVLIITADHIGQCLGDVAHGRVNGHVMGFVHHKDILVFVYDGQCAVFRNNGSICNYLTKHNLKQVVALQNIAGFCPDSVAADPVLGAFQKHDNAVGISFFF